MPLFPRSWTEQARDRDRARVKVKGSWTEVQDKKYKARKKEIQAELARKKQERRDIRRAKLLKSPPIGDSKKFNQKAIAAGEKRRAKAAARRDARKAARKGKRFWEW